MRIAQAFLYCSEAVREWPKFRRYAERKELLSRKTCEGIERNAIAIFQEFVDLVIAAMEADDLRPISEPTVRERLGHAHAYLALHAAPEHLAKYWTDFPKLFDVHRRGSDVDGFARALWQGGWNFPGEKTPAAVTFRQARRNQSERENDGLADSHGDIERVRQLKDPARVEDPEKLDEDHLPPFSEKQEAWIRRGLRQIGRFNGLKKHQVDFLVRLALKQKAPGDDRSATRAIRDRKLERLFPKI